MNTQSLLKNPILPGTNPDPCICKRGDDYYVAVSTFEWFPGVPVYHSKDLKNWRLVAHCLNDEQTLDMRRLSTGKGIWAPSLSWCEQDKLFYLAYSIMESHHARLFDVDNFVITAPEITGPWSEPVYLHSSGFDPSFFHDDDGRKWLSCLEWDYRIGYEHPGGICLVEYDVANKKIIGLPKRIWSGGTDRGCLEGPLIFKRNGLYYILCAEGGTGYGHCVTMGRAESVWGPYVGDPCNPILTSTAVDFNERGDHSFLKPQYYNPKAPLQKAGHASFAETPLGEVYMLHHCARPFTPELRCTLGRETAMQKMEWTDDGWLRLEGGGNLAKEYVEASALPEVKFEPDSIDDFSQDKIPLGWYAPRISPESFTDIKVRKGYVRLRGHESLSSPNRASLLARRLTSVKTQVSVKMEFTPEIFQHYAGLTMYYDNTNYIMLRKYWSESLDSPALAIMRVENDVRTEDHDTKIPLDKEQPIWLRLVIDGRKSFFLWSYDGVTYSRIGQDYDTSEFSDEYSTSGDATGTFVGLFCVDSMCHEKYADFTQFSMESEDSFPI